MVPDLWMLTRQSFGSQPSLFTMVITAPDGFSAFNVLWTWSFVISPLAFSGKMDALEMIARVPSETETLNHRGVSKLSTILRPGQHGLVLALADIQALVGVVFQLQLRALGFVCLGRTSDDGGQSLLQRVRVVRCGVAAAGLLGDALELIHIRLLNARENFHVLASLGAIVRRVGLVSPIGHQPDLGVTAEFLQHVDSRVLRRAQGRGEALNEATCWRRYRRGRRGIEGTGT